MNWCAVVAGSHESGCSGVQASLTRRRAFLQAPDVLVSIVKALQYEKVRFSPGSVRALISADHCAHLSIVLCMVMRSPTFASLCRGIAAADAEELDHHLLVNDLPSLGSSSLLFD